MNYEILYAFVMATAALAVAPGPDNIYVLMQSITYGKKYGLATVAGLMSGCLIHTSLLAFGVSAIIKESDAIFFTIKIFGAMYLFFLAYKVFKSAPEIALGESTVAKKGLWQLYRKGFIMNVLNPKVTIFFLAFFPGFLFSKELGTVLQFYVLGFLFILVSFLIFGLITLLSGAISNYITKHSGVGRFLKWMQIVVFVGIGLYILFSDK